ncbi:MAG: 2-amino-4-hydroxy-6-hydroxymethyldihydropteridine diphosphokinase [Mariprofundales bacterium]|nr:2-amino-4-hydroxy-6-hydroxymethyldihydropteridine diphosphokinase [Mariprofundales bacterium]
MSAAREHWAVVGMGSNIDPEQYLLAGARALRERFTHVQFSQVYRSAAVGMERDAADFLNACAHFSLDSDAETLQRWLKQIEDDHDRDRSQGSWQPRTLDLDLMRFDERWLTDDVKLYPHCYLPAAELVEIPSPPTPHNYRIAVAYGSGYLNR